MSTSLTPSKRGLSDRDLEQSLLRTIQSREVGMANETEAEVELGQETHGEGKLSNSCNGFTRSYYAGGDEAFRSHPRAATAPQGFLNLEWKQVFKGEAINLDVIFSNFHHIASPKENVGCIGGTEISLGKADPARKVQTSGDWTIAWHAATKAVMFAFPYRGEELWQWGDYMVLEFSAKQPNAHHKLITFDKAI